jgi:hypothetical protein
VLCAFILLVPLEHFGVIFLSNWVQQLFFKLSVMVFLADQVESLTKEASLQLDIFKSNVEVKIKLFPVKLNRPHQATIFSGRIFCSQSFLVLARGNALNLNLNLSINAPTLYVLNLIDHFLRNHFHLLVLLIL